MNGTESYIRAAHYFGGVGIGNFWSSFVEAEVERDFARILADGFSHVILVVPWAQFQPKLSSPALDTVYSRRLDFLFTRARATGLKVILRLAYLWDVCPLAYPTFNRIKDLPTSKPLHRAWCGYFAGIWSIIGKRPAFEFAFVSWEDWFWPIYKRIPARPEEERRRYAHACGFQDFLKLKYDLAALCRRYDIKADDWQDVAIPTPEEKAFQEYAAFFDTVLSDRLFSAACSNFPGLNYEFRIDDEWLHARGPNAAVMYSWGTHRDASARQIAYYHPHVGMKSRNAENSAERAAKQLEKLVHKFTISERRPNKVFLDQFNFVTRNPEFDYFSSIAEHDLVRFLGMAGEILAENSSGYGVWGYRDWLNDKLYNSTFELGLDGWSHANLQRASEERTRVRPVLIPGSRLEQRIVEGRVANLKLLVQGVCEEPATLRPLVCGKACRDVEIESGPVDLVIELGKEPIDSVGLELVRGRLTLRRLAAFVHVLTSGLYHRDFRERPAIAAIRALNTRLSGADSAPADAEAVPAAVELEVASDLPSVTGATAR